MRPFRFFLLPVFALLPAVVLATGDFLPANTPVDVVAENLSYDSTRGLVIGQGDVHVTCRGDSIRSDYAEVAPDSGETYARGRVVVQYGGNVWRGEEARYNFRTGIGDFGRFEARAAPFTLMAQDSKSVSSNVIALEKVVLTTCDPDNVEYSIRATSATLTDGNMVRAKHVRFCIGPVPFFYFPYIKAGLDWFDNFEFEAGYEHYVGAYLLTTYHHYFTKEYGLHTHVDFRSERGFGVGQDLTWEAEDESFEGLLRGYYAYDNKPLRCRKRQREQREKVIDHNRYWLKFKDRHSLAQRDYVISELNYLSDPWLLYDFFDDEYQKAVLPENRVTLTHVGDYYTAAASANTRLNDFFENVNRLPEVTFSVNRLRIFDTPFYYESDSALAYLERMYPNGDMGSYPEDYDAFRIDTHHSLYWPQRHFGFLSFIPRARWRGTYFSKTKETVVSTNVVVVTNQLGLSGTNGLGAVGTTNEVVRTVLDGDSAFRSLPELGAETSFKAFRTLFSGATGLEEDRDLRHVIEPYADYTFRVEPDDEVLPENLWQFDAIDEIDKANEVSVGARNKLQTHRKNASHNLVYLDTYLKFLLDPEEEKEEKSLDSFGFKAETRVFSALSWDVNGVYSFSKSDIDYVTTQLSLHPGDIFRASLDYRYQPDRLDQLTSDLWILPKAKWSFRTYVRADLEEGDVQEHAYYFIHRTRCLGMGLGVRIRPAYDKDDEDDYAVWFRFWPLVYEDSMLSF